MKRFSWLVLLAACFALMLAGPAFATKWTLMNYDTENDSNINAMSVVDEQNLFLASDHIYYDPDDIFDLGQYQWVFHSADGGATLEARYSWDMEFGEHFGYSMITAKDIVMISATEGYISGSWSDGGLFPSIGNMTGWVARTADGGYTFTMMDGFTGGLTETHDLEALGFLGANKAFAFGTTKYSFRSENGGATWSRMANLPSNYSSPIPLDPGNELRDLAFDGGGGVYVCAAYAYSSSDDDDYDADDDDTADDDDDTKEGKYFDLLEGSEDGELIFSPDEGNTWSVIYTYEDAGYLEGGFANVEFLDADHGWMTAIGYVDDGTKATAAVTDILYTTDGAKTWKKGQLPTDEGGFGAPGEYVIYDVAMYNLERGWAVGYNQIDGQSVILGTTDGGETWEADDYLDYGELRVVKVLDNRHAYAAGGHLAVVSFFNDENLPPVANAGPDRNVNPGATLALDGTGSSDPDGDEITYYWELVDGPTVTLDDPTLATPTFTTLAEDARYTFQLVVSDWAADSTPDTVEIVAGSPSDDDDDDSDDDSGDDDDSADDDDDDSEEDTGCCG